MASSCRRAPETAPLHRQDHRCGPVLVLRLQVGARELQQLAQAHVALARRRVQRRVPLEVQSVGIGAPLQQEGHGAAEAIGGRLGSIGLYQLYM